MELKSLKDDDGNSVDDYGAIPRVSVSVPPDDHLEASIQYSSDSASDTAPTYMGTWVAQRIRCRFVGSTQTWSWVGFTHGLGWVGWVGSTILSVDWAGLDRVASDSEFA